ncbi:MAG: glycosyltransferase, partial [Solobacterium sp.]|nr:glycosyltransferase [Solobacterium sp.]
MPEVSVIVPVYNVEAYVAKCIDSILAQTFTDYELILVNDGATDGSPAILHDYAGKDPRIHVIDKPNGGLSDARHAGL